jgi:hypothetical protein
MARFTVLEPMSTGDVIDRAVRLYRRNFVPLVVAVAIPSIIGYAASLMFWFGYSNLLSKTSDQTASALVMLGVGMLLYPVWFFTLLAVVAGLSRVVGDHVVMGEAISLSKLFAMVRHRFRDIVLMCLLAIAIVFVLYTALSVAALALLIGVTLLVAAVTVVKLPSWTIAITIAIALLVALAAGIVVTLILFARVVFLPQVIMIEEQSAGPALSRAMRLGSGNWYRVGLIALFSYFIQYSLIAALTLPMLVALYLLGIPTLELLINPAWSALYTAFNQLSNLLALPIWINALTLLYFDSRVRKEGYDVELLARKIAPSSFPQPTTLFEASGPRATPQIQERLGRRMPKLIASSVIISLTAAAASGAANLLDYQKRVFRAAEQIERIKSDSEYASEGISYIKKLLPKSEQVEIEGMALKADNTWLHLLLDSYSSERDAQLKRAKLDEVAGRLRALDQHLRSRLDYASLQSRSNQINAERERLRQILARPEFQPKDKSPIAVFIKKLRRRVADALRDLWDQIFGRLYLASSEASWLIKSLVLAILIITLIFSIRLLATIRRSEKHSEKRIVLGEHVETDTRPHDLAESAMAAARAGDFRTAIRRLYIALLCELSERGLITLEMNATNRDYLAMVAQFALLATPMRYLTEKFDHFWYGMFPSTEDDFQQYLSRYLEAAELARKLSSQSA